MPISDRDYMKPNQPRYSNRGRDFFKGFSIDPILVLILINFAVYLVLMFGRTNQNAVLFNIGLVPALVPDKPWTLITAMFAHLSFWHLFGNMITLFFFGRMVYRMMGGWRFWIIYLVGGLVGNLLYFLIAPDFAIAIGASGAVYALAGALVVLTPNMKVMLYFLVPLPLWVVVIVFFVIWSIPGVASPNIAWQAHLGGLAVGLIAGLIYRYQMRHIIYR